MTKYTVAQRGRTLILGLLLASGVGATSAIARTIVVDVAPPAPRVEVVHSDSVWAPGYWSWHGNKHVWVNGHTMKVRHGYSYSAAHWEERDGRHYFNEGRWDRDHH
jgi:hypothetical protein